MTGKNRSETKSFLRFIIVATLTIVGMALCILSPWIIYVGLINLGLRGEPLNYIALAAFWSFFIVAIVFAAIVDWLRKEKSDRS